MVIFDIPEKKRMVRDIIREHLKTIGLKNCSKVFSFSLILVSRKFLRWRIFTAYLLLVRVMTVSDIDNYAVYQEVVFFDLNI